MGTWQLWRRKSDDLFAIGSEDFDDPALGIAENRAIFVSLFEEC